MFFILTLNYYIALACIGLTVVTVVLFADYLLFKGKYFSSYVLKFAWLAIIGVTVGSTAMSLVYSEYFGIIPCSLCWLQRIAIYPQALMGIMAWRLRDTTYFPKYGIGLSIFGFAVALYQYLYQMMPHDSSGTALPCLADGSNADCAEKVIFEFGFVTFPYLAAVVLAFLIVVYLYQLRANKAQ